MRRPDYILLMCAARKPSQQLRSGKNQKGKMRETNKLLKYDF
jgi:hypothetical protein